jgi:hypothetical protein
MRCESCRAVFQKSARPNQICTTARLVDRTGRKGMKMLKPGREKFASQSQRKGLGTQNSMFTERIQPLPLDICKRSVRQCVSKRETHWGLLFFLHMFTEITVNTIHSVHSLALLLSIFSFFLSPHLYRVSPFPRLLHTPPHLLSSSSDPIPILLFFSLISLYSCPYLRLLLHS